MQKEPKMKVQLDGVPETLLLTTYLRAKESRREDGIIQDAFAEEWVRRMDYNFAKYDKDRLSIVGVSIRTEILDEIVSRFLQKHPAATVVNIGAGLCTRFQRLDNGSVRWFELDVPEALALRERFVEPAPPRYRYIGRSAFDYRWLDEVAGGPGERDDPLLVIVEGVLMYFEERDVRELLSQIRARFPRAEVVTDTMPKMAVKRTRHHRSVSYTSATFKWGLGKTSELQRWNLDIEIIQEYALIARHTKRWGMISWLRFIPFFRRMARMIHLRFAHDKKRGGSRR